MDARSKAVFFQLCRAALRNFVPAGELADGVLFGVQEAIAQHELQRLALSMQHQIKGMVERLDALENKADEEAQQQMIQASLPSLWQSHKNQWGEVFHKLGQIRESPDVKVREFGQRFLDDDVSEYLEETGLGHQFPQLSHDILRHVSAEGEITDLYVLDSELDRGGMSTLFLAQRKDSGEWRALKRFHAMGQGMLERFLIEGFVGKYFLHSEYLVSTLDFGGFLNSGEYFIECELLHGLNLAQWLKRNPYRGPSDPHLRLVGQMLEGLRYLHDQGFIHRDVKPANFFLTQDGCVKMLDFGIIKSLRHPITDLRLTWTNQSLGTPAYKAPEQIDPATFGPSSEKTDIYGLGVTMFELLTGYSLFLGSRLEVERQHLHQAPPVPSDLNIALTPDMDALILACLEKDPRKRPTLDELVELLPPPPALEERTGLLESLCWEGLQQRQDVVLRLQQISEQETANLGPVEEYLDKNQIHKLRERVLQQLHHRVDLSRKQLWRMREELVCWDPLHFGERCPNLLCGLEHTRGNRTCPSCSVDFNVLVCEHCQKTTSYFSERCQRGLCTKPICKDQKMRFVVQSTVTYALEHSEHEAAKALLAFSLLLSGQIQWYPDADSLQHMESLRLRVAQANRIFQAEQIEEFRHALRKLARQAHDQYCREQEARSQSVLEEVSLLMEEGRFLDAHRELTKVPRLIWDQTLSSLEDRIHESLVAEELVLVENFLMQAQPEPAMAILQALPYQCQKRQRLLERTHQLKQALAKTEPRPVLPVLPLLYTATFSPPSRSRTSTILYLSVAACGSLALLLWWFPNTTQRMLAFFSLCVEKKNATPSVLPLSTATSSPSVLLLREYPEPAQRRIPRRRRAFVLKRSSGYPVDSLHEKQHQPIRAFFPRKTKTPPSQRMLEHSFPSQNKNAFYQTTKSTGSRILRAVVKCSRYAEKRCHRKCRKIQQHGRCTFEKRQSVCRCLP